MVLDVFRAVTIILFAISGVMLFRYYLTQPVTTRWPLVAMTLFTLALLAAVVTNFGDRLEWFETPVVFVGSVAGIAATWRHLGWRR